MDTEEAPGHLEDRVHRLDSMPMAGESLKAPQGLGRRLRREAVFPLYPRNGRGTLDGSTPPDKGPRFAKIEVPQGNRDLLLDKQRYQR
jgi:hypothetical protein